MKEMMKHMHAWLLCVYVCVAGGRECELAAARKASCIQL